MTPAQVSLDFLLVCAAFLALLSLSVGALQFVYSTALHSLDILHARAFVSEVSARSLELEALGDQSSVRIRAFPLLRWDIEIEGNWVRVSVTDSENNIKTFSELLAVPAVNFQTTLTKPQQLELRFSDGKLVVYSQFDENN